MLELPESQTLARQLRETLAGKTIARAAANTAPHGFAFYHGDPKEYGALLNGKTVTDAQAYGGRVEMTAGDAGLIFNDGVNARLYLAGEKLPTKHQLLLTFTDGTALVCTIQMYGGLYAFVKAPAGDFYDAVAREKPSPLTGSFDEAYFEKLLAEAKQTLSAKAFLATEQRIPGLGNGVLQDMLFEARIHPKTKLSALSERQKADLFRAVKHTLASMTEKGGRDTEKDLFGQPGGYPCLLSKNTLNRPCPACGGAIIRQAYLGGNIYFCPHCQVEQ